MLGAMHRTGRLPVSISALALLGAIHLVAFVGAASSLRPHDTRFIDPEPVASTAPWDPLVERYAPIVYLHPHEEYLPADPRTFVASSRLVWAHDESCRDHTVAEPVDAHLLGEGRYFHRHSQRRLLHCRHQGPVLNSLASVRPRTRESGDEGFFLDLQRGSERAGLGTEAPVLFHYVPHRYVTYWFFYAYNDGGIFDHDGDWENVTVHLDAEDEPSEVAYYAHGIAHVYSWAELGREGTHPVVFSARGSHASYPAAGLHLAIPKLDQAAAGPRWETALHLRNVLREPWWGYGGGWGQVGETASTTGPKGPSPFKLGVPPSWVPPVAVASR